MCYTRQNHLYFQETNTIEETLFVTLFFKYKGRTPAGYRHGPFMSKLVERPLLLACIQWTVYLHSIQGKASVCTLCPCECNKFPHRYNCTIIFMFLSSD